jgi:phosphate transport system permease protein
MFVTRNKVPSIVFGLLGLAIFLNFFGLPRSVPLAGGLVLTAMNAIAVVLRKKFEIRW